jgi:hypothetical protein
LHHHWLFHHFHHLFHLVELFHEAFISSGDFPEPFDRRLRRLWLITSGFARSYGVIELIMASTFKCIITYIMSFIALPTPGIMHAGL